jgi:hypothetical protein
MVIEGNGRTYIKPMLGLAEAWIEQMSNAWRGRVPAVRGTRVGHQANDI